MGGMKGGGMGGVDTSITPRPGCAQGCMGGMKVGGMGGVDASIAPSVHTMHAHCDQHA